MRELVDGFVNNAVDTNCSANEFQFRIIRVAEDEVVPVELSQGRASNPASQLRALVNCLGPCIACAASLLTVGT